MKNNKKAWEKFDAGDGLSDKELDFMIEQCENALPYLLARGPKFFLASSRTLQDKNSLEGFKRARKRGQNVVKQINDLTVV